MRLLNLLKVKKVIFDLSNYLFMFCLIFFMVKFFVLKKLRFFIRKFIRKTDFL